MEALAEIRDQAPSVDVPPFSDSYIETVARGSSSDVANWVLHIVRQHGVTVRPSVTDRFARAVSLLSDGETDLDPIEQLLLALSRSKLLTPFQRGLLHIRYLG